MRGIHVAAWAALFTAGIFSTAQAQTFDGSGNSMLNGDYGFRHVTFYTDTTYGTGSVTRAIILDGIITFDGAGNYSMNGYARDTRSGTGSTFSTTGLYRISASGFGYLQNPNASVAIFGSVTNGTFIGSTTEVATGSGPAFNDIFIATQAHSATVADVQGNYTMAYFNGQSPYDALATFSADGKGGIGTAAISAYPAGATTPVKLNEANISYSFTSGVGKMVFPTSGNPAIAGNHTFFVSPDGDLIFGGSDNYLDFWIGIKTPATNTAGAPTGMSGLYYQAGMSYDTLNISQTRTAYLDTFWGSFYAHDGVILNHHRAAIALVPQTTDYTSYLQYPTDSGTTYTDTTTHNEIQYFLTPDGSLRLGFGLGPYLGVFLATRAPTFTSPGGVYIDPTGIQNAASYALFTEGVSPGEIITINGSGFADGITIADAFPLQTTLADVSVQINSTLAPLISVTPTTVSVVVPYGISGQPVASIQVQTNNGNSNAVTMLVRPTTIGAFSAGANGIGPGAILHAPPDYSLVTADNPAMPGETVAVYFTGGGTVSPPVIDGRAAPSSPLAMTDATITAYAGVENLNVSFGGLAPGFAGLYQANIQIPPDTATAGAVSLQLCVSTSCNTQVTVAVGTAN